MPHYQRRGGRAKANDSDFTQISDTLGEFGRQSSSVDKALCGDEQHLCATGSVTQLHLICFSLD